MSDLAQTISKLRELLAKAKPGPVYATVEVFDEKTVPYIESHPDWTVWTVSHDPNEHGWETDCNTTGYGLTKAEADILVAARNALPALLDARDNALEEAAKLLDLRRQDILLIAGEMTAQEIRSVRAMLNERARAIRALKSK